MAKARSAKNKGSGGARGARADVRGPSLGVTIGRMRLANPVMTASGTFGYGQEFAPYTDLKKIGAIVVKGLSLEPRAGNPPVRIVETPCGMLNAIGLQNVGVEAFIKDKLPFLRKAGARVVANIFGETVREYGDVAARLDGTRGVSALEVNISCPNVKKGGMAFGIDPSEASKVIKAVRRATSLTLIAKLSPNVTDIGVMVRAVEDAGCDAVSLINTITGMAVDVERRRAVLSTVTGGLSGPAIRPVAVRMVWEAYRAASVPVIGIGGIVTARDALEFIIAGASAIQVGTASFLDPRSAEKVVCGIESYMKKHHIKRMRELTGSLEA